MKAVINVKGDVLNPSSFLLEEHKEQHVFIIHNTNSHGVMGSGIALQVREQFPEAYTRYNESCKQHVQDRYLLLGTITSYLDREKQVTIINAICQLDYGTHKRQVNYEAIAIVFEDLVRTFNKSIEEDHTKHFYIAIPKFIGCGLAGGNWEIVLTIITQILHNMNGNCTLYIVEWSK